MLYPYDRCRRKREARKAHERSAFAQKVKGLRAKMYNKKRFQEKAEMKKTLNMHQERKNKHADEEEVQQGAVPAYLLDRQNTSRAKVLSNMIKQKRKEKAGKWAVPLPKVRPIAEEEMFRVVRTGKSKSTPSLHRFKLPLLCCPCNADVRLQASSGSA